MHARGERGRRPLAVRRAGHLLRVRRSAPPGQGGSPGGRGRVRGQGVGAPRRRALPPRHPGHRRRRRRAVREPSTPAGTPRAARTCTSRCTSTEKTVLTAQLFFDDAMTDGVYAAPPLRAAPRPGHPQHARPVLLPRRGAAPRSRTARAGSARSSSACRELGSVVLEQPDDRVGRLGDVERHHRHRPLRPLVDELDRQVPRQRAASGPKQASSPSSPTATSTSHWSDRSAASSAKSGSDPSSGSGASARTG